MSSNSVSEESRLLEAYKRGNFRLLKNLLDNGANPNVYDVYGVSLFLKALSDEHEEVVNALFKAGADLNGYNIHGETALFLAIEMGYSDIVSKLLEDGVDVNKKDKYGYSALLTVLHFNYYGNRSISMLRNLLERGASLNGSSREPPALWYVADSFCSSIGMIKVLLEFGANPNVYYQNVTPLLLFAAKSKFSDYAFQILLDAGANPNLTDKEGNTPLHLLVDKFGVPGAKLLINYEGKYKMDLALTNKDGMTAYDIYVGKYIHNLGESEREEKLKEIEFMKPPYSATKSAMKY